MTVSADGLSAEFVAVAPGSANIAVTVSSRTIFSSRSTISPGRTASGFSFSTMEA